MFLLDTNILSELTKPRPEVAVTSRIYATSPDRLFASEMSRYELRYGAQLRDRPEEFWERVASLILPVPVWIPVESEVAMATGDLDARLRRQGTRIELADVCIAATALAFDLVLVTRNVRHFENVPALSVENWFPEGAARA